MTLWDPEEPAPRCPRCAGGLNGEGECPKCRHSARPVARNTDPTTSHRAARRASAAVSKNRILILHEYQRVDPADYSAKEIAQALYLDGTIALTQVESIRRRVTDYAAEGLLAKTGEERDGAEVYRLTPRGRAWPS